MSLQKEFEALRSLMLLQGSPFLVSLLYRCKIVATKSIVTAGVDKDFRLLINPEFFAKLNLREKAFVLFHEIIHLAFLHPQRMEGKEPENFNIAADCVTNTLLDYFSLIPKQCQFSIVTADKIALLVNKSEEEIKKFSVETIYQLLKLVEKEKLMKRIGMPLYDLFSDKKLARQIKEEAVIQQGDSGFYDENLTLEERKTYWREAVSTAILAQKTAGYLPTGLARIFDEFLKSKLNWRSLLKKEITIGLGKTKVIDWRKTSRKHPLLPGLQSLEKPTIFSLIDTSGSISQQELSRFLSENFTILRLQARIVIIPWDAQVYDPIEIENPSHFLVKTREKIRGGGGTVIYPALTKALQLMKQQDIVIVFTDGVIFDITNPETQRQLQTIGRKSSRAIFVTANETDKVPSTWIKIKMEP